MEKQLQKTWVAALLAGVCCLLWGSAFPCIKIGYGMMKISSDAASDQILYAGYRFTLAGILVIGIGSILNRRFLLPKKSSLKKIGILSLFQTVLQYLLFYVGLANTTGVKASIIEGTNVFFAILAASLLFRQEKLTARKICGCVLGFLGVVIVNLGSGGLDTSVKFMGEGCILLSTVAYAISSVMVKRFSKDEDPVVLSGYQFALGGVVMILAGKSFGGNVSGFTAASILLLFYLAFLSAAAYTLWGILLKYNPVSKIAVFGFMNPVFGVLLSALLLREGRQALGMKSVAALLLVCAGIYIVNRNPAEKERIRK